MNKIISFPHLSNYYIPIKYIIEKITKLQVYIPPYNNKQTISLGAKYSPDDICMPFKYNLGNYINALNNGANILVQAGGGCRYGYFAELQEQILKDLGYEFNFVNLIKNNHVSIKNMYKFAKQENEKLNIIKFIYYLFQGILIIIFMDKLDKYKKEAEFYSEKFFRIHGDKFLGTKKEKEDRTYVGYTHLTDETGSLDYPTLGKVYENRDKYLQDIENIKKAVDVFQYFDKPIYHTLDYVNVNVVKLDKSTVLEIVFGDFRIVDINSNVKNLDKFKKLYEKFKQFRIQLQYKDEFFIMDCLKNISIIN